MRLVQLVALAVGSLALIDAASSTTTGSGSTDEDRIFGGKKSDIAQHPYIANLRMAGTRAVCGGALIAPQYILTAAHCIKKGHDLYAAVGSQFASGKKDGEHFKVTDAFLHPRYKAKTHEWDLAILKLDGTSKIAPVKLGKPDGSDNGVGAMATVRGWGMTEAGVPSESLEELQVKIVSNRVCNKQYRHRIKETMLCAGQGDGKDSCQGDSGGPLVANGKLVGAVSWGGKCGEHAGVYTRLSMMHGFIRKVIGKANYKAAISEATAAATNTTAESATNSTTGNTGKAESALPQTSDATPQPTADAGDKKNAAAVGETNLAPTGAGKSASDSAPAPSEDSKGKQSADASPVEGKGNGEGDAPSSGARSVSFSDIGANAKGKSAKDTSKTKDSKSAGEASPDAGGDASSAGSAAAAASKASSGDESDGVGKPSKSAGGAATSSDSSGSSAAMQSDTAAKTDKKAKASDSDADEDGDTNGDAAPGAGSPGKAGRYEAAKVKPAGGNGGDAVSASTAGSQADPAPKDKPADNDGSDALSTGTASSKADATGKDGDASGAAVKLTDIQELVAQLLQSSSKGKTASKGDEALAFPEAPSKGSTSKAKSSSNSAKQRMP